MEPGTGLYFVYLMCLRNVTSHHVTITLSSLQSNITHIISCLKCKDSILRIFFFFPFSFPEWWVGLMSSSTNFQGFLTLWGWHRLQITFKEANLLESYLFPIPRTSEVSILTVCRELLWEAGFKRVFEWRRWDAVLEKSFPSFFCIFLMPHCTIFLSPYRRLLRPFLSQVPCLSFHTVLLLL